MDNPLEQPAPDDPIARVHEFARDLAWGAVNGKWGSIFNRWSLDVLDVTEPENYRHATNELILYIQRKWFDGPPSINLMRSFEYFTPAQEGLVPRDDKALNLAYLSFLLTPKAFALLDKPTISVNDAQTIYDYMKRAEQHLANHDHESAAGLSGAVLEKALRCLCQRQDPPIETERKDGSYKKLDWMITELQKQNVFSKSKAAQLRSWAAIRNPAVHGKFEEFDRDQVEQMIPGIETFLADYL